MVKIGWGKKKKDGLSWKDGKKDGWGVLKDTAGRSYAGEISQGQRHGRGVDEWGDGTVYDGEWKCNMKHGRGTIRYSKGDVYEGDWKDDKKNGRGSLRYADGNEYDGEFVEGRAHGRGILKHSNGNVYDGEWVRGQRHGRGSLKDAKGDVYIGNWEDGRLHGDVTKKCADRRVFDQVWNEGKLLLNEMHTSPFFKKLVHILDKTADRHPPHRKRMSELGELAALIEDVHMMKLLYTAVATCRRTGALEEREAKEIMRNGLEQASETCVHEEAIVIFKLILDKAESDQFITMADKYKYDNRGEIKRIENAPFIKSMMQAIQFNTRRIEGVEQNVKSINESLNNIRAGLKRKMKVEAAVACISCILNVVSPGVGGTVISAAQQAAMDAIIDFGDPLHIMETVAETFAEESEQCEALLEDGRDIASGHLAERKLEAAVRNRNILVVVSAVSHMVHGGDAREGGAANDGVVSEGAAYAEIADATCREGNFAEAVSWLTEAINVDGSNHLHYFDRSVAYQQSGDLLKALEDVAAALTFKSEFLEGYLRKGYVLHSLKRYREAISAYERGLELHPDSEAPKRGLERVKMDEEYKTLFRKKEETTNREQADGGVYLSRNGSHFEVKLWLMSNLPRLQKDDVKKYCKCFVEDGFDSVDMLEDLEEGDLHFMRKAHRRSLLKQLSRD